MNTEQLKMILDALKSMGDAGHDAFVWWLVLDKGLPVLGWLALIAGAVLVARWGIGAITTFSRIDELRGALGLSVYSSTEQVLNKAIETIRKQQAG